MEWKITKKPVPYPKAITFMENRVDQIIAGKSGDLGWLLEHPPLYTSGTSSKPQDLMNPEEFPVYDAGRGGQFTYHGPGQRVVYVMKKLEQPDIRKYVYDLEQWIIDTLDVFDIVGERRKDRIGIWVQDPELGESKIAAIGVRVKKWVAYHGIAINIHPNLKHFEGIVPCGIHEFKVTSLWQMKKPITLPEFDQKLKKTYSKIFRPL